MPAEWQTFLSTRKTWRQSFWVCYWRGGGEWWGGGCLLEICKVRLPNACICSVISSQLLAALLWQTWASANVQSPERRGSFHEILHLISQSWPQVPEIRGLTKLNAYSLYSPNCGNMWKWTSNKWMLFYPRPWYPQDCQFSMQERISKINYQQNQNIESIRTAWPRGMCILVAGWSEQTSHKRKSPWQSQSSKGCLLHRYWQPDISVRDAARWKHAFRHPSQCPPLLLYQIGTTQA